MAISLDTLTEPGVVGFHKSFEAVEVFAVPPNHTPINILTVIVFEEVEVGINQEPEILNKKRIKVNSLKGWNFGIKQYRCSLEKLQAMCDHLVEKNEWLASGEVLRTGRLHPMPQVFVPPDATGQVPLNRILKNNFWNGSHVLEWGDITKDYIKPLFEDSRRLRSLSEQIESIIPIRLASLSDRLGHLIIQVPVKIIMSKFGHDPKSGGLSVSVAWAKESAERPLHAACFTEFDGLLTGTVATQIIDGHAISPLAGRGKLRGFVWDPEHGIALAASAPLNFLTSLNFNLRIADQEPRTFSTIQSDGTSVEQRVSVSAISGPTLIGEKHGDDIGGWTNKRIYAEEANKLAEQRIFKSYRPSQDSEADHASALKDLRALVAQHGEHGAWLWDPYLSAQDVISTLFYCPFSNVGLRALSAAEACTQSKAKFIAGQKEAFQTVQGNLRGLSLEFRVRRDGAGWPFHDRFLIFPKSEGGALAWSLGTSVNGLGKAHHILQQVDNGQMIADAFQDLWDALSQPEHLIWKR